MRHRSSPSCNGEGSFARGGDPLHAPGCRHARQGTSVGLARLLGTGLLVTLGLLGATESLAQEVISREYTIKGAYLYNFGRYVRWPEGTFRNDQAPFVIGVFGTDPFGDILENIAAAKNVEGRKIVISKFRSLDEPIACQILFVPKSTDPQVQVMLIQKLRGLPVLLVGETPAFAERGGTVNFSIEQNKLRIAINQEAAKRSDLRISAKLLSLAVLVEEDPGTAAWTSASPP
jgi:hypothetical protein